MADSRSKSWWKISCIGCVGLPCLSLMFLFGWMKCQISSEGSRLEAELAKLQQMGIPTEPEDLQTASSLPDSQNAAVLYRQINDAFKKIHTQKGTYRHSELATSYSGFPGDRAEYVAALKTYQPVFDLVDRLPDRPQASFKPDYSKGYLRPFPELSQVRTLVRMLASRIVYRLDQKQYPQALDDIETQLIIANHFSAEADPVAIHTCIDANARAFASLDRFLYTIQDNPPLLQLTEEMLLRRQTKPDFRRALHGELVLGRIAARSVTRLAELEQVSHMSEPDGAEAAINRLLIDRPEVKRMFEARAVALWREVFEGLPAVGKDWREVVEFFEKIDAKIEGDRSIQNRVNQILWPGLVFNALAFAKTDAHHRVALLAVKLLRQRPTGLPAELSSFGDLAIDPIDGKPMRYVRTGNGFKVWSIGSDQIDHGGQPRAPMVSMSQTDIVLGYDVGFAPPKREPVGK